MIQNLYETHLEVHDLDRSVAFYEKLGLQLAERMERMAFFWIGEPGAQMLGLWIKPQDKPIAKRHFAFGVTLEELTHAKEWLAVRGIPLVSGFGEEPTEPIVHTWMPAAAVYFNDPDGNSLEFITMLSGQAKQLNRVPYLSEWNTMNESE